MLFILIPIVWLAVTLLFLCICAMAARGDAQPQPLVDADARPVGLDRVEAYDPRSLSARDGRSRGGWHTAARGIG